MDNISFSKFNKLFAEPKFVRQNLQYENSVSDLNGDLKKHSTRSLFETLGLRGIPCFIKPILPPPEVEPSASGRPMVTDARNRNVGYTSESDSSLLKIKPIEIGAKNQRVSKSSVGTQASNFSAQRQIQHHKAAETKPPEKDSASKKSLTSLGTAHRTNVPLSRFLSGVKTANFEKDHPHLCVDTECSTLFPRRFSKHEVVSHSPTWGSLLKKQKRSGRLKTENQGLVDIPIQPLRGSLKPRPPESANPTPPESAKSKPQVIAEPTRRESVKFTPQAIAKPTSPESDKTISIVTSRKPNNEVTKQKRYPNVFQITRLPHIHVRPPNRIQQVCQISINSQLDENDCLAKSNVSYHEIVYSDRNEKSSAAKENVNRNTSSSNVHHKKVRKFRHTMNGLRNLVPSDKTKSSSGDLQVSSLLTGTSSSTKSVASSDNGKTKKVVISNQHSEHSEVSKSFHEQDSSVSTVCLSGSYPTSTVNSTDDSNSPINGAQTVKLIPDIKVENPDILLHDPREDKQIADIFDKIVNDESLPLQKLKQRYRLRSHPSTFVVSNLETDSPESPFTECENPQNAEPPLVSKQISENETHNLNDFPPPDKSLLEDFESSSTSLFSNHMVGTRLPAEEVVKPPKTHSSSNEISSDSLGKTKSSTEVEVNRAVNIFMKSLDLQSQPKVVRVRSKRFHHPKVKVPITKFTTNQSPNSLQYSSTTSKSENILDDDNNSFLSLSEGELPSYGETRRP